MISFVSFRVFSKAKLREISLAAVVAAVLGGIVLLAFDPGSHEKDVRNAQRTVDVGAILNAVYEYAIDHEGEVPQAIPLAANCSGMAANEICKTDAPNCTGYVDLSLLTMKGAYLLSIPVEPKADSQTNGAGYSIVKSVNGSITVCAPRAEGTSISVSR